jgi:hypothetical protein
MEKSVKIEPKLRERTKERLSLNPQEPYRLVKNTCFEIDSKSMVTFPSYQVAETRQTCNAGVASAVLSMQRQQAFR